MAFECILWNKKLKISMFSVSSTVTLFAQMGLDSESLNESGNPLQQSGKCAFWSHFYNVGYYQTLIVEVLMLHSNVSAKRIATIFL